MTETPLFGVVSEEVLAKAIAQMPHGRAMQPDEVAAWVMNEPGIWLGTGSGSLINLLNPEMVVLCGGMIAAGDDLFVQLEPPTGTIREDHLSLLDGGRDAKQLAHQVIAHRPQVGAHHPVVLELLAVLDHAPRLVVRHDDHHRDIEHMRGIAYALEGRTDEARELLQRVTAEYPQFVEARQQLQQLPTG